MNPQTALIIYFALANGISFICSMLEAVILSMSHSHIAMLIKEGHRSGQLLKTYKEEIDRPLAAVLTLNTISHTVGAAGVGAQVQAIWGSGALAMGSAILTFSILFFAEIIPKTIGAAYWKQLAPASAVAIHALIVITYPIVLASDLLAKVFARGATPHRVTREEMAMVAEMGATEGELATSEHNVITNLLHLDDIRVNDILTPRSVICAFQKDRTVADVMDNELTLRHSRLPVYTESVDDVDAYVLRYEILEQYVKGNPDKPLRELEHKVHVVPVSISVREVLDQFIERKEHLFLVADEYGGTEGIVTLEDAIETLLGLEIMDELDNEADLRKWARDLWEKRREAEAREL